MPVPRPARAAAAGLLLLATGCAQAQASPRAALPQRAVSAELAPPDLAGHQFDPPHAERVLVAGDTAELSLPGGTVRIRVTGPALKEVPQFAPTVPRPPAQYLATFGIAVTGLTGRVALSPADFSLLELTDQRGTAAPVPHAVPPTRAALSAADVSAGQSLTGSWTAPFTEGHGEFVLAPSGVAPAALWDFRAEA